MSDPMNNLHQFYEVQHHRVTVEYRTPRLDWLSRLISVERSGAHCTECLTFLGEDQGNLGIYVNTEGPNGDPTTADLFCSWACLLRAAARCVDEEQPGITIKMSPDA